jgi:hypothetical protein
VKRLVVAAFAALALAAVACDDTGPYLFLAQQYEPGNMCVDNYAVIDNIDGDDPGALCSPVCLTNMGIYYITTECPPYPYGFDAEGQDGAVDETCMTALAAFARADLCVDGGPPTNPLDASPDTSPPDAAAPADASPSVDATTGDATTVDATTGDATTD